jgi:excisionase family DNA binding protein
LPVGQPRPGGPWALPAAGGYSRARAYQRLSTNSLEMFTVKQLAQRLEISQTKAYRIVETGEIGHHKFGAAVRITEAQLAAYLKKTEREPEDPTHRRRERLRYPDLVRKHLGL